MEENKIIQTLFKSKNPFYMSIGILVCLVIITTVAFKFIENIKLYADRYETTKDHKEDIISLSKEEDLKHRLLAAEIAVQIEKMHHHNHNNNAN